MARRNGSLVAPMRPGHVQWNLHTTHEAVHRRRNAGRLGWKREPLSCLYVYGQFLGDTGCHLYVTATLQSRLRASFSFSVLIYIISLFSLYFSQKSLPLLENQIKESHQKVTADLQICGMGVPEDDNEKTSFLIDVSVAFGLTLEDPVPGGLLSSLPQC